MFSSYENAILKKTIITIENVLYKKDLEEIAISFSGGKDSTVLKHLVHSINPHVKSIFCNTGVEYDQIVDFVKKEHPDTEIIKPKKSFWQIVDKYGYPAISKEQSRYIFDVRNPNTCKKTLETRLGYKNFSIAKKWRWILKTNIQISHKCCYFLKEYPLKRLGYYYFTGERIQESNLRRQRYHTCTMKNKCIPLRLWTDEMIEKYIQIHDLKICDIYKTERRTGCKYCLYGVHMEKGKDRVDRLKYIEPKSYNLLLAKGIIQLKNLLKSV
jgi:3'-phosphoadenosine 5'-phosphosulfate sulfotransferase (PAPS reductase)/FAD synthetase